MLRLLSSTRLTIALCLVLATVGVAGSVLYNGNTVVADRGSANLFHSPLFLAPSLLLMLNVAVCAVRKLRSGVFGPFRAAAFLGLHAGLLLLAAAMIVDGRYAFVGTQYYRIGKPSSAHFDWRKNEDRTFPFTVEVAGFYERFHPKNLQIGVKDPSGKKLGVFVVREGASFTVPGNGLKVTVRAFDIAARELTFDASAGGLSVQAAKAGVAGAQGPLGFTIVPVGWKEPEVSEFVAHVRFNGPGALPESRDIRVNHPAKFGGITFCLSGSREDDEGNRIVGLQMTREPGAPWFWAGSLLFGASLLANLYRRTGKGAFAKGSAPSGEAPATATGENGAGAVIPALLFAVSLSCALPAAASAFGRSIAADESWEGEVKIVEPVVVEKGATLTIRAGTVVLLSGGERGVAGTPDGGIQVFGSLRVEGEPGNPVRFARLDPALPWNELFIKDATAIIRHADFSGALWGLHIHDSDVSIERTTLHDNMGGARLRGIGVRFDHCEIRDNDIGFRFWRGGPRIRASAIEGNRVGLFYRDGVGGGKINGCRIANREVDAKIGDWASGSLDLSGNYWGGRAPKLRDFRNPGAKGKIRITPVLRRPPAGAGTG